MTECFVAGCGEAASTLTLLKSGTVRYRDARICAGHLREAKALGYEVRA